MSDVEIKVNSEMIKGIIDAKVQAAILNALKEDHSRIIEGIINTAMNTKVGSNGQRSQYSSDNKYNWVEIAVADAIKKVAQETIIKWLESEKPAIEKVMVKELQKQREPMVKAFVDSFVSNAKNTYGFKVEIKPRNDD